MKKRLYLILTMIVTTLTWVPFASAADPIKIGAPLAMSGRAAFAGLAEKNTLMMLAEEFNKNGGLNGRPLEFIYYDTEMKPDIAVNMVKRLIKKDKVTAIVGITASWTGITVLSILEKERIPSILLASSSGLVDPVRKWIFKIPSDDRIVVAKMQADTDGMKTVILKSNTLKKILRA